MINLGYSELSIEEFLREESSIPFDINRRVLNRNNTNRDYSGVLRTLFKDYESGVSLDDKLKSFKLTKMHVKHHKIPTQFIKVTLHIYYRVTMNCRPWQEDKLLRPRTWV